MRSYLREVASRKQCRRPNSHPNDFAVQLNHDLHLDETRDDAMEVAQELAQHYADESRKRKAVAQSFSVDREEIEEGNSETACDPPPKKKNFGKSNATLVSFLFALIAQSTCFLV
jgi:hypothetical protein